MRNKVTVLTVPVIISVLLILLMASCTSASEVSEDDILNDMTKGLVARWDYQDSDRALKLFRKEKTANLEKYYKASIDKEMKYIGKYKDDVFENAELGELVVRYIDCLEDQQELLSGDIEDYWTLKYDLDAYQWYGNAALNDINKICSLGVPEHYQMEFNHMINETDHQNMADSPAQVAEAFTVKDTKIESSGGKYEPRVKVKNNTDCTFSDYALVYRIKSSDGTVVDTGLYDYISSFDAGSERFTVYSGPELKPGYTYEAYGYAVSETEDDEYVGNTIKLPETVTVKITE